MTKAYNDIDAVTRLLEEKERDLELAARIGQSLLEQNKDLRQKNEQLEHDLTVANDTVTQLRHELSMKNGLLQIYTQDPDTDSESGSPLREKGFVVNWEVLNKKINALQEENIQLRTEASVRTSHIETEEKKEMQLVNDCVRELRDANMQINGMQEEIARKAEDNIRQQEEITQLLSQVVDLQRRVRDLTADNEVLHGKLQISEECQHELSVELIEVKDKYGELMAAFQELQDEAKKARKSRIPVVSKWQCGIYSPYLNPDSLASELESSLGRDSDGYSSDEKTCQNRKVFDTVKYANGSISSTRRSAHSHYGSHLSPGSGHHGMPSRFSSLSQLSSISSCMTDSITSDSESAYAESYHTDDDGQYSSASNIGKSGSYGFNDVDATLHRLSSGVGTGTDMSSDGESSADQYWNPDTITCGKPTFSGHIIKHYHIPEKLQIIKPLEGSQTLSHWQRLATPHLGGLFEPRPGVQIKGERKIKELDEVTTLSDLEEDEDYSHPGKSFMNTSSVYTYTTSVILHPSDQTQVTPSYPALQLSTRIMSQPPSALNSPQQQQRERATSTFSTTLGLAKLLNERGIHAMVPTVASTAHKIISPTPTPTPSPEGSPPPTPPPFNAVRIPDLVGSSSLARGLHLLKKSQRAHLRTTTSTVQSVNVIVSSQETKPPPVSSIGLLDKLSSIGFENIMSTMPSSTTPSSVPVHSQIPVERIKTIHSDAPLTITSKPDSAGEKVDVKSTQTAISMKLAPLIKEGYKSPAITRAQSDTSALSKPWGYVPPVPMLKSPAAMGLTPAVAPPLSRMPNPVLQLNSLRNLRPTGPDIGTVGSLRTLRKGGYI